MAWYWSEAQWNTIVDMAANERRHRIASIDPTERPVHRAMYRRFANDSARALRKASACAIHCAKRPALIFT